MFLKKYKNLLAFKPYYKRHTALSIVLLCVMLIASTAGLVISYLMSEQLIGITNEVTAIAVKFTILILVTVTIHHICWFLWGKFQYKLARRVATDIKSDIVRSLLNTKYSFIQNNGSGYYLERLNDDTIEISNFFGNVAGTLVDVFTNFGFLAIIYILNWQCGLLFTIGVVMLFIIESIRVDIDLKNLNKVKKSTEIANSQLNEVIHGIRNIKGFGIKSEVNDKLNMVNANLLQEKNKKDTTNEFIARIGTYLQWIIDSVIVFVAMLLLLPHGQITAIIIILIFNYKGLMYDTVGFFSKLKGYYINGDFYAGRVLEILNSINKENFGDTVQVLQNGRITIKDLSFRYNDKKILNNINIEIRPNSLNILIGNNGSGKTTLFLLLSKLYEVENGKIFFDDIDINKFSEKSFRENICIVNQSPFVFNDTILNNIKIVKPGATQEEVEKVCKLANIHYEILNFEKGYQTIISENGNNLSGGQLQRIEIARAFLKDSKIILLDEPTSALDIENQEKLFKTLSEIKVNKTIFLIAHKLNNYEYFDNIFKLDNGNIIQTECCSE